MTSKRFLVRRAASPRCSRLLALMLVVSVGATACGGSASDTGAVAEQPTVAEQNSQGDQQTPAAPQTQDDTQTESSTPSQPAADGSFGPKPILQTFQIQPGALTDDGTPIGVAYTYTQVDSRDDGLLYVAIGDASGVRSAVLDRGDGQFTVCGNAADGCGIGTSPQGSFGAVVSFDTWHPTLSLGRLRIPATVELNDFGGWELFDENFSNGGRPGNCYRSLGQDDTGSPSEYPAGDVACTVKHEATSQFIVSYDHGGDGVFEVDTIKMQDSFSDADLVLPPAAADADQATLDQILANLSAEGDAYNFFG